MSVDYISTDPGVDSETRACARLLTAVIAEAVRDVCTRPTPEEQRAGRNIDLLACQALNWLFEPSPIFVAYAGLIGADATAMTEALLSDHLLGHGAAFSDTDRRIVQLRHRWWLGDKRLREHLALREQAPLTRGAGE